MKLLPRRDRKLHAIPPLAGVGHARRRLSVCGIGRPRLPAARAPRTRVGGTSTRTPNTPAFVSPIHVCPSHCPLRRRAGRVRGGGVGHALRASGSRARPSPSRSPPPRCTSHVLLCTTLLPHPSTPHLLSPPRASPQGADTHGRRPQTRRSERHHPHRAAAVRPSDLPAGRAPGRPPAPGVRPLAAALDEWLVSLSPSPHDAAISRWVAHATASPPPASDHEGAPSSRAGRKHLRPTTRRHRLPLPPPFARRGSPRPPRRHVRERLLAVARTQGALGQLRAIPPAVLSRLERLADAETHSRCVAIDLPCATTTVHLTRCTSGCV